MDSSFTRQINLGNFGGADGMGIVFHTGSVDALDRRVAPFVLLAAGLRVVACVERAHGMVHGGR